MKRNLLIIEDDDEIREMMAIYFNGDNYNVIEAESGEEALHIFECEKIDLVFLDLMLPEMDGLMVCKRLREDSDVPVIMITAKSQEEDKLRGFSYGADEYVTKPFSLKVLEARAEALLKRIYGNVSRKLSVMEFDGLMLDTNDEIVKIDDAVVQLTRREYDLLLFLVHNRGITLSKNRILDSVWGFEYEGDPRAVDTCISRIRKKIADKKYLIQTVSGMGYRFGETSNIKEKTDV